MNGVTIAIWPIALVIVLVIIGVPLWLTFRRRQGRPDYRDARAHYRAKAAAPSPEATSDYVPTGPVSALDGLTIERKHGTESSDEPAPDDSASSQLAASASSASPAGRSAAA